MSRRTGNNYSGARWLFSQRRRKQPEAPPVHNHGTEEGPGLACREHIIDGRRIGECLMEPQR